MAGIYMQWGGTANSVYYNDVQYAPINANGTLGTWQSTASFTNGRDYFEVVAHSGYLYIMGGNGSSGSYNDVQYAPINFNGSVGTWQTTSSFTNSRYEFGAASYNGYLYIMGGQGSSGTLSDLQYAPINNGGPGTTGAWTSVADTTGGVSQSENAAVNNGYIYVWGGQNLTNGILRKN